jgi:hypothetical protein
MAEPAPPDPAPPDPARLAELRDQIALGCRILAMEGAVDGVLGHISVRARTRC